MCSPATSSPGIASSRFPALLDAAAPGIAVAQAIGRLGNWFNQELFGRPTTLPWGLQIAEQYRPLGYEQYATFHPTFLYELIWCLLIAGVLVLLDRRFRLGHGKVFALYVVFYTLGRFWIESLRIDTVNHVGGFRLNNYTSLIVFVIALAWFLWLVKYRPGREEIVEPQPETGPESGPEPVDGAEDPDEVDRETSSEPVDEHPPAPDRRETLTEETPFVAARPVHYAMRYGTRPPIEHRPSGATAPEPTSDRHRRWCDLSHNCLSAQCCAAKSIDGRAIRGSGAPQPRSLARRPATMLHARSGLVSVWCRAARRALT